MSSSPLARVLGIASADGDLIDATRKGLPAISALRLAQAGGLSDQQLAGALGVSTRTLARKKGKSRLNAVESDRAMRLGRVLSLALEIFWHKRKETLAWLHASIIE